MKRSVRMAMLAAAAAAVAAGVPAAAQTAEEARIVSAVSQPDLLALAAMLRHQVVEEGQSSPALIAMGDGGVKYFVVGTACDREAAGCQGILLEARFDLPPGVTAEAILAASRDFPAVTITADFAGHTLTIARYLVLDHGVTMANIAANVNVFLAVIPEAYTAATAAARPQG